uniref:Uncharacterized protein n=1 Tax=Oryza sativa subsp. japonica TaxID=39947 RepID=Q5VNQ9_ORYSJ|nr:hypothetical protein [Oryza sativa Japonica Group]
MIATAVCTQSRRYDGLRFSQRKPVNVDVYPLYHLAPSLCVTYLMALQADEDPVMGITGSHNNLGSSACSITYRLHLPSISCTCKCNLKQERKKEKGEM